MEEGRGLSLIHIWVMMSMILSSYLTDKCLGIALIQPLILPPARAAFMGANTTSPICLLYTSRIRV